jgi:predicted DNA binding CopG/RHH family protein
MTVISQWEDIPRFENDRQEVDFWRGARLDVRLMENSVAAGANANESVTITLRMDPRMLSRIKRLARSRFLNYQSMIKQWLSERMESETGPRELS